MEGRGGGGGGGSHLLGMWAGQSGRAASQTATKYGLADK